MAEQAFICLNGLPFEVNNNNNNNNNNLLTWGSLVGFGDHVCTRGFFVY